MPDRIDRIAEALELGDADALTRNALALLKDVEERRPMPFGVHPRAAHALALQAIGFADAIRTAFEQQAEHINN